MNHRYSVFTNACLTVPVDPVSKMPKTAYERNEKTEHSSIDSSTICSVVADDYAEKLKEFYKSIPDYKDINHLTEEEFYSTLQCLREKKKLMLGLAVERIDCLDDNYSFHKNNEMRPAHSDMNEKSLNYPTRKLSGEKITDKGKVIKGPTLKRLPSKGNQKDIDDSINKISINKDNTRNERPKRNHSACSISWNDTKIEFKDDVDEKFEKCFRKSPDSILCKAIDDDFKTQSMPSSPLRIRRIGSPLRRRKSTSITIPKPFKMTERDEEERIVNELRSLRKSFSADMLDQKCSRKQFKANPVPIESRIPLYDRILEDQAMRRAITKINSEAELRAQMKPFSFTKREEKGLGMCDRAANVLPKSKKKKRFKARPVPKNLFSNYFYDKKNEDDFFRAMNRKIRAEETLRSATLPGSMALRDRSRLSTPAAHSDLPVDPSPAVPSTISSDRQRCTSPTKERKKRTKDSFITTSPQPFRFNTADRAAKKMEAVTKKYQESKSTESIDDGGRAQVFSALELRGPASGRSNLAVLLRVESMRRRAEMESAALLAERRRRSEMRQRDRLLRSKPAWHLVKNNHEEDIAMRLQTRRDEERMRREEFLHEMELMYERVRQQPLLFERYYAPKSHSVSMDTIQLSPRRKTKKKSFHCTSPMRSRKVFNDAYSSDMIEFLNRVEDKYSDSEVATESLDRKL